MPAFNLRAEDSDVKDVSITETGDTITVGGTYVLNIENTGLLPLFVTATVNVDELEVTGVVAEEDLSSTTSGSGEVEFDFSFTQPSSQYINTADSICSGLGQIDVEATGSINGIIASSGFDQSVRKTLPSVNCSISTGSDGGTGGDTGGGNGGDTGGDTGGDDGGDNGGDNGGDTGGDNGGDTGGDNGGDDGNDGAAPPTYGDTQVVNLDAQEEGYDDPYVDTEQTYQLQENGEQMDDFAEAFGRFDWTWTFGNLDTRDRLSINGSPSQLNYTWDETGTFIVTVQVYDNQNNETILTESMEETVVENPNSGGWLTAGGGTSSSDDGTPSMDEAADSKDKSWD